MKAIVTGAAGFLGRRLCQSLLADGWLVTGAEIAPPPPGLVQRGGFGWITRDLSRDGFSALELDGVDVVFHLAALLKATGPDAEQMLLAANEGASINVFRSVAPTTARVVFASTQMVYGDPNSRSVSEDDPKSPEATAYGLSKWNAERWLSYFQQTRQSGDAVVLRFPGFIEGPDSVFAYFTASARAHKPIELFSRGEICRDYLPAADAIQAFRAAAALPHAPGVRSYNIGSGAAISTRVVAEHVVTLLQSRSEIVALDKPAPRAHFVFNIDKARSELQYTPTPLLSAIESFVKEDSARAIDRA